MLPDLFKSDDRVRMFRFVSENNGVTVQSTAEGVHVSKPVVSRYLNMLTDKGLCSRKGRSFRWLSTPIGNAAKRLVNIVLIEDSLSKPDWAKGIGFYGSWARGTNTRESDLDLWILVEEYNPNLEFAVAEFEQDLAEILQVEVHILILNKNKLGQLSKSDVPFYTRLIRETVTLRGEGLDET